MADAIPVATPEKATVKAPSKVVQKAKDSAAEPNLRDESLESYRAPSGVKLTSHEAVRKDN